MNESLDFPKDTRLLFLGDDRLADGFRLVGFETFANPDSSAVETLIGALQRDREKAFVVVDDRIMSGGSKALERVRREGGRILVVAVPRLGEAPRLTSSVSESVVATLGNGIAR